MKEFKKEKKKKVMICLYETTIVKGKEVAKKENRSLSGLIEDLILKKSVDINPPNVMKDFIGNPDIKEAFKNCISFSTKKNDDK